jgi:hypothetical protein
MRSRIRRRKTRKRRRKRRGIKMEKREATMMTRYGSGMKCLAATAVRLLPWSYSSIQLRAASNPWPAQM